MTIEKNEEILVNYRDKFHFNYGSREYRRQDLLENFGGLLCLCESAECSLEGEDFEENERIRAEIREDDSEIRKLLRSKEYVPVPRRRRL